MSSGGGGAPAPISDGGRCPSHPSIQLARRRRDGTWHQFLKECPLCSADDDASQWSGSAASSSRSIRSHPSKAPSKAPSKVSSKVSSKAPSKEWRKHHQEQEALRKSSSEKPKSTFKEVKEDVASPASGKIDAASPKIVDASSDAADTSTVDPNDTMLLRQKEMRKRVKAGQFPPLPFPSVGAAACPAVPPTPILKRSRSADLDLDGSPEGSSPHLSPLSKSPPRRGPPRRAHSETITKSDAQSALDRMDEHKAPRTLSLEALIQSRKEKVRELKLRRLVPPSQRFPVKDGAWETVASRPRAGTLQVAAKAEMIPDTPRPKMMKVATMMDETDDAGDRQVDQRQSDIDSSERSDCSLHSISSEQIGSLAADVEPAREQSSSIHSMSTQHMGNLTPIIDRTTHGESENDFSFRSDATHHMGAPTGSIHHPSTKSVVDSITGKKVKNVLHVVNVPSPVVEHTIRTGILNASTLEISYDSFVEHGGRKCGKVSQRIDSDEITEVTDNTGQERRSGQHRQSDSSGSIAESEIDALSLGSQDDLNLASRDIWSGGSADGEGGDDNRPNDAKPKMWPHRGGVGKALRPGGIPNIAQRGNVPFAPKVERAQRQHPEKGPLGNLGNQLDSLNISDAGENTGEEQVEVEGVTDDEEESAHHSTQSSLHPSVLSDHDHGVEPPGHMSVTSTKQFNYELHLDPPAADPPLDEQSDNNSADSSLDLKDGLDKQYTAFNGVVDSRTLGQTKERKEIVRRVLRQVKQESDRLRDPSSGSSSSRSEASGLQCFERKKKGGDEHRAQRSRSVPRDRPEAQTRRNSQRSAHTAPPRHRSSSRTRDPTRVDERTNTNVKPPPQRIPMPKPVPPPAPVREYKKKISDSSEEGEKVFNKCDSKGRCIHHPHIQLRRKRLIGGRVKGKWKTIMMNCTECCYEEVQRLRTKNARVKKHQLGIVPKHVQAKKQLGSAPKRIPKLPKAPHSPYKCDTSATASMTSASGSSANSSEDPRHPPPIGILKKKPRYRGNDSDLTFSSNESESTMEISYPDTDADESDRTEGSERTTTFSYLSSLSASASSSGFTSAYTSSSGESSADSFERNKGPKGILRRRKSQGSSPASSKGSSRSSGGRVCFAGRDSYINLDEVREFMRELDQSLQGNEMM